MALKVHLTLPPVRAAEAPDEQPVGGGEFPESYARILQVRADPTWCYLLVAWYTDEAARIEGADPIKLFEFGAPAEVLDGKAYSGAYAHLKTLPGFEGATDC